MATKKPKTSAKSSSKSKTTKPKTAAKTVEKPVSEAPKTKTVVENTNGKSIFAGFFAKKDEENGRRCLEFPDGSKSYFPDRIPKSIKFPTAPGD